MLEFSAWTVRPSSARGGRGNYIASDRLPHSNGIFENLLEEGILCRGVDSSARRRGERILSHGRRLTAAPHRSAFR